jgi:hypothetical protein
MRRLIIATLVLCTLIASACGSSSNKTSSPTTASGSPGTTGPPVKTLGAGVTANSIKLGVMMIDYSCVEQFVDTVEPDQQPTFQVFIDNINKQGGINGRKIVPVYKSYCPINQTSELSACTSLTEDAKVFAVVGTFYDPSGDAQLCFAKQHKTPVIADTLTDALIAKAPGGMMLTPDIANERRLRVLFKLLKGQGTLNGKTVAVVSDAANKPEVTSAVVPALKDLGVKRGTDAVLNITGSDTTAAQTQLDSFIERWKTDGTNALIMVGDDVVANQFVEKIKKQIPNMQLVADNTSILDNGQQEQKNKVSPNPYAGAITAEGQTGEQHKTTPHYAYCSKIWETATGRTVPDPDHPVYLKNGKKNNIYDEVETACLFTRFFQVIAQRVGQYLNVPNWISTVNNYGSIDDTSTIYATIHAGKYDADNTYGLVAYDPKIGAEGDWDSVTPVQNVDVP